MHSNKISLLLLLLVSPLLVQCATQKEVQTLDLRIRNVDNRLVRLDQDFNASQSADRRTLERLQKQLAQQNVVIEELRGGILQAYGQLDEGSRAFRLLQEENERLKKQLAGKVGELTEKMTELTGQMDQTVSVVEEVKAARLREETERVIREAKEAELAAAKAKEQAAIKAREQTALEAGGPKRLEPSATKKKVKDGVPPTPEVVAKPKPQSVASGGPLDKALAQFKAKRFKEAHRLFLQYLEANPRGDRAAEARFYLGESLFSRGEYELSILEYQRVIDEFRHSAKVPIALLQQGRAFEKLNDLGTAKMVYYKLLDEFPTSAAGARAQKRLDVMN